MSNIALDWIDNNGVAIIAGAGNSRDTNPDISLIPVRLFRNPQIIVGSVRLDALAHPNSQGSIGDAILTAFAPGPGARVVSSDPSGAYTYAFLDPTRSAFTSYCELISLPVISMSTDTDRLADCRHSVHTHSRLCRPNARHGIQRQCRHSSQSR